MKDFGYYKNIINQHYNPEKKVLTKKIYYELHRESLNGNESASKELFQRTCFFAYDIIAHAYAEGVLHGEFEDDLQETFLLLKNISIGKGPNRKREPYFSTIPRGVSYKTFISLILTQVFRNLNRKAKKASFPVDIQKSYDLNELLQNPENVAITNACRPQIAKLVAQSGNGQHEDDKKLHGQWLRAFMIDGLSYKQITEEHNVSRQAVSYSQIRSIEDIQRDQKKLAAFDELLH